MSTPLRDARRTNRCAYHEDEAQCVRMAGHRTDHLLWRWGLSGAKRTFVARGEEE